MLTNKEEVLEGAKQAFFKAMMDGYAGDRKNSIKTTTPDGYKTIEFTDGEFKVVDRYCITPDSDHSAGTTTIFFKNVPVWWMSYGRRYPKNTISFLKEALKKAYGVGEFCGGRGPDFFTKDSLQYHNAWAGDFSRFQGGEEVFARLMVSELVGFHKYFGMSLL
jgi:hypothetical protein